MLDITLFSKPGCQPCKATKRKLDELEIIYNEVNVLHDHEAADHLAKDLGYKSVPVVKVDLGDDAIWTWQGYAPSQIERLWIHLEGLDPEL